MSDAPTLPGARRPAPGLRLAIDYAPLAVFFLANFLVPGDAARRWVSAATGTLGALGRLEAVVVAKMLIATAAFVLATLVAMAVSLARLRTISPMLWVSGMLVVVFGGLTIYFQNPNFIKIKPTIVYAILSLLLWFGLLTGRPLLQQMLGDTYPGLSPAGWRRLTVNWAVFFLAMAAANETVWRLTAPQPGDDPRLWVLYKFPGCVLITFAFALANVPMLMRHGLMLEDGAAAEQMPPE